MVAREKKQEHDTQGAALVEESQVEALKKLRIVIRAAQRHSAQIEKLCGVTGAQLWVMQELYDAPGLRVGEVAEKLAVHQTTASNLLDALVKKGCIDKLRDPNDHRVVKLVLSKQGATVLKNAPKPARGLLPEALRKLEPHQLAELTNGLRALLKTIDVGDDTSAMQPLSFTM